MRWHHPDPTKLVIKETDHPEKPWVAWSDDPEWVELSIRRTGVVARFATKQDAQRWKANQLRLLPVITERTCGSCRACCTPLGIPEIDKPPGVPCKHLVPGGCGIYDQRPRDCREYFCGWRLGTGTTKDRPDLVGLLLTPHKNVPDIIPELLEISFVAHEIWPNARRTTRAQALLHTIAARGFLVLVTHGSQCQVVGPASLVQAALLWCHTAKLIAPYGILADYTI